MKRIIKNCSNCGDTDHVVLGFIPAVIASDRLDEHWFESAVCTICGGMTRLEPSMEQIEKASERYVNILVEEGIISETEAKNILG